MINNTAISDEVKVKSVLYYLTVNGEMKENVWFILRYINNNLFSAKYTLIEINLTSSQSGCEINEIVRYKLYYNWEILG